MKRKISEFRNEAIGNLEEIKGGVRCPHYLVSAVRSKDPATLQRIIKRFEAYSPETAKAVASAVDSAGIELPTE